MKKFQSHKTVEAAKIIDFETVPGGARLTVGAVDSAEEFMVDDAWVGRHSSPHHDMVGGYLILYPDGYLSWSPAAAFEEGYTAAGEIRGLPVAGYKPTQPPWAVDLVGTFKLDEERLLRRLDSLKPSPHTPPGEDVDQRWLAIGRTHLEEGFMFVNRAIFQPQRFALPEDQPALNFASDAKGG